MRVRQIDGIKSDAARHMATYLVSVSPDRGDSVHVSDIISYIRTKRGDAWDDTAEKRLHGYDLGQIMRFSLGLLWEHGVVAGMRAQGIPLLDGAFSDIDDITLSPDIITPLDGTIHECKFTWKSTKRLVEEDWYWMVQIKAYLYALRLHKAQFHVGYVNGNYKRGTVESGPMPRTTSLEFTQAELDENWKMLRNHWQPTRDQMLQKAG